MSTSDPIVDPRPGERAGDEDRQRRRFWWIVGSVSGAVLAAIVGLGLLVELPYFAVKPGQTWATEQLVDIDAADVYESDGEVHFTTVSLRRVTAFEALVGWLDDDIEVVPEEEILHDRSPQENRQLNQVRMDNSKLLAAKVALEELGYEVPVTVTGETVVEVEPGTPAGEELEVGDTIVEVDGVPLRESGQLTELMADTRPGDSVRLGVDPAGREQVREVELTLAEHPDGEPQGFIGVRLTARGVDFDLPFDVEIDTRDIGGPSAGLAFTLSILDLLTPGDLTGGVPVAVTGTIEPDGDVGAVGGVVQKTATVRRAGIELFLVPPEELEQARSRAGSEVRVVAVETLDGALEALGEHGGDALDPGAAGVAQEASGGD